jgi:hypothetical protein
MSAMGTEISDANEALTKAGERGGILGLAIGLVAAIGTLWIWVEGWSLVACGSPGSYWDSHGNRHCADGTVMGSTQAMGAIGLILALGVLVEVASEVGKAMRARKKPAAGGSVSATVEASPRPGGDAATAVAAGSTPLAKRKRERPTSTVAKDSVQPGAGVAPAAGKATTAPATRSRKAP